MAEDRSRTDRTAEYNAASIGGFPEPQPSNATYFEQTGPAEGFEYGAPGEYGAQGASLYESASEWDASQSQIEQWDPSNQEQAAQWENASLVTDPSGMQVATTEPAQPESRRYEFRKLMDRYNYSFDEKEEEYVGATTSEASSRLLAAIEYAREYMRTNSLYLLQNQLKAVGGGKSLSSSKSSKKRAPGPVDEMAAAHQAIDLYAKPSDLGKE
jgi:hypothetical protein